MIPNECRCFSDMFDVIWLRSQKTRQNKVGSDEIIGQQNSMELLGGAIEWPIAVHPYDAICNDEVRTNRGADVENAFVDSRPVKDVFRPTVAGAGNDPKHVF